MSSSAYRKRCETRRVPLISPETEAALHTIIQTQKPKCCVEIGSAVWYSSSMIAQQVQEWNGQVYGFEIAHNAYTQALFHTKHRPNLTLYPFDHTHIAMEKLIIWPYDFVFIDWQKSQYDQYFMKIEPFLHPESVIVCDDVIKFQNKLFSLYGYLDKMQIFHTQIQLEHDDGIMLIGEKSLIQSLLQAIKH